MSSRVRSPRYPIIDLREAVERARKVYSKDHRNWITKQIVAEHIGYRTLNGKSLGVISAIIKYGLLEGTQQRMRVTDRALAIFAHEQGAPERNKAIAEAAAEPELFRELDERFSGRFSDSACRAYLITQRGFLPSAADTVVRVYRGTKELVTEESPRYDSGPAEGIGDHEGGGPMQLVQPEARPQAGIRTVEARGPGSETDTERTLLSWDFESTGFLRMYITGDVDTEEALDMAETLIQLKRKELNRKKAKDEGGEQMPLLRGVAAE